jgi:uncharacterized membrane protein (DUF373 family)
MIVALWQAVPMVDQREPDTPSPRRLVVRALAVIEDVVYVGLGLLLTVAAITLLITTVKRTAYSVWSRSLGVPEILGVLDQILLILLIIELLYTVQVSFREHGLSAEPFLIVALIAAIRRVMILTAEYPKLPESNEVVFRHAIVELALLTVMILVLVTSFIMLEKQKRQRAQR